MYIKVYDLSSGLPQEIGTYTEVANLYFAPSADLAGASIPINEFQIDIHTTDMIEIGYQAELYDDMDNLWAQYWITYAEHTRQDLLSIKAQSEIGILDRITLPAVYYSGESITNVLDDIIVWSTLGSVIPMGYTLDSSFANETITGFCPNQTARERLLWVTFTIGAYVKTFFNQGIEILPIDSTQTTIPVGDIYWKPTVIYNDWVTAIRGHAYSFTIGTPSTTDTYVEGDIGNTYIVTETTITIQNQNVPAAAPENIVEIEGVYLLNEDNLSGVLTRLTDWYFNRTELDFDAINNRSYLPGDKVLVQIDDENLVSGYISSATFAFGVQAKATMHLTGVENVDAAKLTVLCKYNGKRIGKKVYTFPVGYAYSVDMPYIDLTMNGHRYIFRPTTATVTGTMASGGTTVTVDYAVALDLHEGILKIISVDGISTTTESGETVGVIE